MAKSVKNLHDISKNDREIRRYLKRHACSLHSTVLGLTPILSSPPTPQLLLHVCFSEPHDWVHVPGSSHVLQLPNINECHIYWGSRMELGKKC